MNFDSSLVILGDEDLNVDNGFGLAINENASTPDDEFAGGVITFDFTNGSPITEFQLSYIDGEEGFFLRGVTESGQIFLTPPPLPGTFQDGSVTDIQTFDFSFDPVTRIDVVLIGSGAIGDIGFTPLPEPSSAVMPVSYTHLTLPTKA